MDKEMRARFKNETWDVVLKPKCIDLISFKWVYKLKRKADSHAERYKVRLNARDSLKNMMKIMKKLSTRWRR